MSSDVPPCYGRSWTLGDDECEECDLEYDCRDVVKRKRQQRSPRIAKKPKSAGAENVLAMTTTVAGIVPAPRQEGEPIWARIIKNFSLGAASRLGVEASLLAEDERLRPIVPQPTRDDGDPEDA